MTEIERVQCPFKVAKYRCKEGKWCSENMHLNNGMPTDGNECPVAERQKDGRPWKTERKVKYNKYLASYFPLMQIQRTKQNDKVTEK